MPQLSDLLEVLQLEPQGPGTFRAQSIRGALPVVFGGQLMAQALVAATVTVPGKEVKSLHTVFARSATADVPLEIHVQTLQNGRSFASVNVEVRQQDRVCTHSIALLHVPDPDLMRHAKPASDFPAPEGCPAAEGFWWDVRIAGGVDIGDPKAVGPAELDVWSRFPGASHDTIVGQALLAYATDGFLIGTAMRPHAGIGQAQAHRTISTTVLAHTLDFHEPIDAADWLLLRHQSPYAGRGRTFGRGDVFTGDGQLVASFAQENMVRDFPDGAPAPGTRAAH